MEGQLEELYAAHFRSLTAQIHAYTADFDGAQEIVQEAFCRAIPRWPRLVKYDDPVGWIRKVAFNLAVSRWRRARTAAFYLQRQRAETVEGPSPDRIALIEALKTLPEKHRRAVVLHHLGDQPVADIAKSEGVPEATVRTWLHRGRNALAERLVDDVRLTHEGVQPPGLEAARAKVARRRAARTVVLAIIAAVLLVVTAVTSFAAPYKRNVPVVPPTPSASAAPEAPATPSATASPTPSPSATASPAAAVAANGPLNYRAIFASSQNASVLLPRTQPVTVVFGPSLWPHNGGNGTVHNLVITANLSAVLAKVEISALPSQCGISGATLTCRYPALGRGDHLGTVTLRARSGAAAGPVGNFSLRSTADEGSRYRDPTEAYLAIHPDDQLADIDVTNRATNVTRGGGASDQITIVAGDRLSVTTTIVNRGPATATVSQRSTAGLKLVSGDGCRDEDTWQYSESLSCTHSVAPGATVRYTTLIDVTACNGGNFLFGQARSSLPAPIDLTWRNQWMINMDHGC